MIREIINFAKRVLFGFLTRKQSGGGIYIGRAEHVLTNGSAISLQISGRAAVPQLFRGPAWKRMRGHVEINPGKEPNPHIVIVGMSGFGKSTLFKSMLVDIHKQGIPAIVFDAHNEHEATVRSTGGRVYDAATSRMNILELNGLSKQERIAEVVALLKDVYSLGYIQAIKLSQCLGYAYRYSERRGAAAPTVQDLMHEIGIFIKNARTASELNSLMHLKEKMSLLGGSTVPGREFSADELGNGISSFSLAGMKSPETRLIYMHELLKRTYLSMKGNRREAGVRMFIMIDEAQFLLRSGNGAGVVRGMVEEGRKYGAGVIIATHITSNLDRQILANASTLISFYARDPREINYVSAAMSGSDPAMHHLVRQRLRTLGCHEAMVVSGLVRNPTVVRTRRISELAISTEEGRDNGKHAGDVAPIIDLSKPVDYETAKLHIGEEEMSRLLKSGNLQMETAVAYGAPKLFVMARTGKSIEHEVSVGMISKRLTELGVGNYIMNRRNGPDIVAYLNGRSIAVEYETGRKSISSTEKMLQSRIKSFWNTVVFVNDASYGTYSARFGASAVSVIKIGGLGSLSTDRLEKAPPNEA